MASRRPQSQAKGDRQKQKYKKIRPPPMFFQGNIPGLNGFPEFLFQWRERFVSLKDDYPH